MVPKIRKILYATDLSENSRPALRWAFELAKEHNAKVVLFHSVEGISAGREGVVRSYFGSQRWESTKLDIEHEAATMMKQRVEQFCREAKAEIALCPTFVDSIVVKRGYSVDRILRAAEDGGCDIVVMGTHNSSKLYRLLMANTAQRIIKRSCKPIFVVPLAPD
jgi:nucleotide-binding universal stress UspA family protein